MSPPRMAAIVTVSGFVLAILGFLAPSLQSVPQGICAQPALSRLTWPQPQMQAPT